ncbi:unnamed protein product [Schistocephalus solidus]|uniref:Uncharacterized protein n=1 Tax=Schistocephalus solidus TaxID=70667 RepID=A0A183T5T6_SCHSO|nr:unnamed protein product [Schistocephalus solidus]
MSRVLPSGCSSPPSTVSLCLYRRGCCFLIRNVNTCVLKVPAFTKRTTYAGGDGSNWKTAAPASCTLMNLYAKINNFSLDLAFRPEPPESVAWMACPLDLNEDTTCAVCRADDESCSLIGSPLPNHEDRL